MRYLLLQVLAIVAFAGALCAEKSDYIELAQRGWGYELRSTMLGRDMAIPVHINGRDQAGAALCLVGEKPHPQTLVVLDTFRALLKHSFGHPTPMRYAGPSARDCGTGRTVVLRLYSGYPPNRDLSSDIDWLSELHQLGLPAGRNYVVTSPAMAQTFFGYRGQGTHIVVKQPAHDQTSKLERDFHKSILLEELFQSFTFGMDILLYDKSSGFLSKLQETPVNLQRLPWSSHDFMRALLDSNPSGLCAFDIFMMHAVAQSPVDQTIDPGFIEYINAQYDRLWAQADETLANPRFAALFDEGCTNSVRVPR
ncbi:hypothetical protein [Ruegeria sp. HKCCSP346]|uniref:hypothetical protein n=1 Tax=Ruegeria sp. HKCCSP346 TaxID=2794830 RepID=UPI001AE27E05|nr:hypothetical protein [Ruegeria sp. HKCCSP346]